jgi:HEAT repeat protein
LAGSSDPRVIDALLARLNDSDEDVRWAAVYALKGSSDARVIDALLSHLNDPNAALRRAAADALAGSKDARIVDALLGRLDQDPNGDVRQAAARALVVAQSSADACLHCERILARWPTAKPETRALLYDILAEIAPRAYHAVPAEARAEWRARVAEITRSFRQTG